MFVRNHKGIIIELNLDNCYNEFDKYTKLWKNQI